MIPKEGIIVCIFLVSLSPVLSQTNGVRQNLIQCYNSSYLPEILTANGRSPASLNVFIEFVRRLEESNPTITARELSALILQR